MPNSSLFLAAIPYTAVYSPLQDFCTIALSSESLYKEQYISALRIMKPFYCKVLVGGSYRYCPDVDGLKVHCNAFILMTHIPTFEVGIVLFWLPVNDLNIRNLSQSQAFYH